jgi:hypothetical protein
MSEQDEQLKRDLLRQAREYEDVLRRLEAEADAVLRTSRDASR